MEVKNSTTQKTSRMSPSQVYSVGRPLLVPFSSPQNFSDLSLLWSIESLLSVNL